MRTVNIHEAKTHLSRLIDEVETGEPIVIAKAGKPKAKLVPANGQQDILKRRVDVTALGERGSGSVTRVDLLIFRFGAEDELFYIEHAL